MICPETASLLISVCLPVIENRSPLYGRLLIDRHTEFFEVLLFYIATLVKNMNNL
jgi:hypothetical protein